MRPAPAPAPSPSTPSPPRCSDGARSVRPAPALHSLTQACADPERRARGRACGFTWHIESAPAPRPKSHHRSFSACIIRPASFMACSVYCIRHSSHASRAGLGPARRPASSPTGCRSTSSTRQRARPPRTSRTDMRAGVFVGSVVRRSAHESAELACVMSRVWRAASHALCLVAGGADLLRERLGRAVDQDRQPRHR